MRVLILYYSPRIKAAVEQGHDHFDDKAELFSGFCFSNQFDTVPGLFINTKNKLWTINYRNHRFGHR